MRARNYRHIPTVWIDYKTGQGVTDEGHAIDTTVMQRRKRPTLADMLNIAALHGAERIMLCGTIPVLASEDQTMDIARTLDTVDEFSSPQGKVHWLLVDTPGWVAVPPGHWLGTNPTGRFTRDPGHIASAQELHERMQYQVSKQTIEVRTASEWFNEDALTPRQARNAWVMMSQLLLSRDIPSMAKSPARTGLNAWLAKFPRSSEKKNYELHPVDEEIAEVLHSTSGQGRVEHFAGKSSCSCPLCGPTMTSRQISGFTVLDGRLAYAKPMANELHAGLATRLTQAQTRALVAENPYAGIWAHVTVTVPDTWDHIGLVAQKAPESLSWHYPRKPGAKFKTWAGYRALAVARKFGWGIEYHESIDLGMKGRWMQNFSDTIVDLRQQVEQNMALGEHDHLTLTAVRNALRNILLFGVGSLASRAKTTTWSGTNALLLPDKSLIVGAVEQIGDRFVCRVRNEFYSKPTLDYQPGLALQIWADAAASVVATKTNGVETGAMSLDPRTILGIRGDAIHTTTVPDWALPVAEGGADDGKVGRLRVKGTLEGPLPTPMNTSARNKLRRQAEGLA